MIASWWNPPGWRWRPKGIDYPFALRRRHFDRWLKVARSVGLGRRHKSRQLGPQVLDLFFSSILLCVSPEVTVTSLHPPRLCRIAVL